MPENTSSYPVGYTEHVIRLFSKRNIHTHASFLLPHLKPGMSLLDCGCGPGSITVGFADYLKPGKVVGTDISKQHLDYARKSAEKKGVTNIEFMEADITQLPFEDNAFDAAYTNAVLCHVSNPMTAIKELKRVVKKGGVVGVREMDWGAQLIYPDNPLLIEALEIREKALQHLGCNYRIGRQLRKLFTDAGYERVDASANCEVIGDESTLKDIPEYMASQWETAPFAKLILEKQWATEAQIKQFQQALRDFAKQPGAFRCWTWCQVVGFV